jgi:hypothetical protein
MDAPAPSEQPLPNARAEAEARAMAYLARRKARPQISPAPPISRPLSSLLRPLLKQAGPSIRMLAQRWPDIVGPALARVCEPVKLTRGKAGASLTLRAVPAAAILLQHQTGTLLERVNLLGGGKVVTIKIVQGPLTPAARRALPVRASAPLPLTAAEEETLQAGLSKIKDPNLRASLEALGRAVHGSSKRSKGS